MRASIDQEGPAIAVGVDLRKYFTRIMGAHAAATALFGFGTGALIGVVVDATLRIGPFGRGFPLYLGAGVWMGPAEVFRNGDSALGFYGGGVVEGGFLFGEGDRFDVGLRGQIGIATSGNAGTYSGVVMFGYRL